MLREIILENFKCFREATKISFNQINLLTGINGRGKSTTLQALLLMRQSPEHSRTTNQIIFNGSCVELGRFKDVRNSNLSLNDLMCLHFVFEDSQGSIDIKYKLSLNEKDDMVADIKNFELNIKSNQNIQLVASKNTDGSNNNYEIAVNGSVLGDYSYWYNLLIGHSAFEPQTTYFVQNQVNFSKLHYISADRIGPRDYYLQQSFTEFPNVGRQGEYTANILFRKQDELVHDLLCKDESKPHIVLEQTEAWLNSIFDGGKIKLNSVEEANLVLMALNSEDSHNVYKPINVGFGYSYALPIIVSGLVAQPGEMLVVENPEAHLHPYAQSQLVQFLARVSATGVQVFIESHSEHILNGLRIALLDEIITQEALNILYFQRDLVEQIKVDEKGGIDYWPTGFFDQTDKDFKRLFGF